MQKNYYVGKYRLDNNQMSLLLKDENSLVVAGAGAGKTLTILGKINYLIENHFCKPENILVISFTNASVNDIKSRIEYKVNVFTFHKLAMLILDKSNYNYSLCDANFLKYIIEEYLKSATTLEQKNILKFLKLNIKYYDFLKSNHFDSFCKLIETFINIFKTNNPSTDDILNKNYNHLQKQILIIIFSILKRYNLEKASVQKLDFDDLIIYAREKVKNSNLYYKYIIIDEFQDTSSIRLNLIKEIYKYNNSKIIVVGDDWQSIYRFSGCDLNIFLNFTKIFPNVNVIKLSNTYRNSLELITIASQFIQKNPLQMKKNLFSEKSNKKPIIFVPYLNPKIALIEIINYLTKLSNDIIIISRNNNDIYKYLSNDLKFENNMIIYKTVEIKYYSVHKSKGLEAEYVIILNCNNEILGFPNKIENNSLVDKLNPSYEMKYAEERRLFYVALTRCKTSTYLLYNKNNPSIFIKEIKKITKKHLGNITYFK